VTIVIKRSQIIAAGKPGRARAKLAAGWNQAARATPSLARVRWLERPMIPETERERTARRRRLLPRKPLQHRKLGHRLLNRTEDITLVDASHPIAFDLIEKELGGGWV
jgi:hypothetical protein